MMELRVEGKPLSVELLSVVRIVWPGLATLTHTTAVFRCDFDFVGDAAAGELTSHCCGNSEGEDEATVCGFAIDIDGELAPATFCAREAARHAFDRELFEQRVAKARRTRAAAPRPENAAVLEQSAVGGSAAFRVRVFPVVPHGRRTVRVSVLSRCSGGGSSSSRVRFAPESCEAFTLSLRVVGTPPGCVPELVPTSEVAPSAPQFALAGGEAVASWSSGGGGGGGGGAFLDWKIVLRGDVPRSFVFVERVRTSLSADCFFVISDTPAEALAAPARRKEAPLIGVFWDTSFSQRSRSGCANFHSRKRALLKELVCAGARVVLFLFHNATECRGLFSSANIGRLLDEVDNASYKGSTCINALAFPDATPFGGRSEFAFHILISDGCSSEIPTHSWDKDRLHVPVHCVASPRTSDGLFDGASLRRIASRFGGCFHSLPRESDARSLALRLLSEQPRLLRVEFDESTVCDVVPSTSIPVRSDSAVRVSGRLLHATAGTTVTLVYGFDEGRVTQRASFVVASDGRTAFVSRSDSVVSKVWASMKASELEAFEEKPGKELLQLSKEHGVLTSASSLLFLETLEQFLDHGVEPPESRRLLHSQWILKHQEQTELEKQRLREKQLYNRKIWNKLVSWWSDDTFAGDRWRPHVLHQHFGPEPLPASPFEELATGLASVAQSLQSRSCVFRASKLLADDQDLNPLFSAVRQLATLFQEGLDDARTSFFAEKCLDSAFDVLQSKPSSAAAAKGAVAVRLALDLLSACEARLQGRVVSSTFGDSAMQLCQPVSAKPRRKERQQDPIPLGISFGQSSGISSAWKSDRVEVLLGDDGEISERLTEDEARSENSLSILFSKLRERSKRALGIASREVVVTVPETYTDRQRQAVKDSCLIAELRPLRIINRPTAVALAYGLETQPGEHRHVVVFADAAEIALTVLCIEDGIVEILGSHTIPKGSSTVSNMLAELAKERSRSGGGLLSENAERKLWAECDQKRDFIEKVGELAVDLGVLDVVVTRSMLHSACLPLASELSRGLEKLLADSGVLATMVESVLLSGDSLLLLRPFQQVFNAAFGKNPLADIDPEAVVSRGAALQASLLSGARGSTTCDLLLLDVAPLSIGIGTAENGHIDNADFCFMAALITRNTTIPCKKTARFLKSDPSCTQLHIRVFEGERATTADNNLLGEFELACAPANMGIAVTAEIDANGILRVSARCETSGSESSLVVSNDKGRLSKEQIEQMIEEAERFCCDTKRAPSPRQQPPQEEKREEEIFGGDETSISEAAGEALCPPLPSNTTERRKRQLLLAICAPDAASVAEGTAAPMISLWNDSARGIFFMESPHELPDNPTEIDLLGNAAQILLSGGSTDIATSILLSLADLALENEVVLRAAAYLLLGFGADCVGLFAWILSLRPEDPQSLRDLACALALRDDAQSICSAADHLSQLLSGSWGLQHNQIERSAILDLMWLQSKMAGSLGSFDTELSFSQALQMDLRVVLTWNTDADVELVVQDPSDEICNSFHNSTRNGGQLSRDFTHGLGPVEFNLRTAKPGRYTIFVRLFSQPQSAVLPTVVSATIFTHFCCPERENRRVASRLLHPSASRMLHHIATAAFF